MYGLSYWGNTQWTAAIERPPSLVAITPAMTWSDPMDGLFARGGAVELGLALAWSLLANIPEVARQSTAPDELEGRLTGICDEFDLLSARGYWELPVHQSDVIARHRVPDLGSIRALDDPHIADRSRVAGAYDQVQVPTFHVAGWYDTFLQGTLDSYRTMAELRADARLVVGPWTHLAFADPVGDHVFGLRSSKRGGQIQAGKDLDTLLLVWLRHHLVASSEPDPFDAPVRIFVMGRNVWRSETAWPPKRVRDERWYLRSDGALTPLAPAEAEQPTEFTYDPADPVLTVGGNTVMFPSFPSGAFDQSEVERRGDVVVFTSDRLDEDLEVTGRIRVALNCGSSAQSTDWVARLSDVYPDGRSINLCDGILRVTDDAQTVRVREIDLWSTSNVFLRGHRLRVAITSSSFPRWDRNLNTSDQHGRSHTAARQSVHHTADHPSFIELPVMP
jgi:hypothetical protein